MWCSLISACNIVCRTSLGHNKTDEFEINCLLLCNDGEDKVSTALDLPVVTPSRVLILAYR